MEFQKVFEALDTALRASESMEKYLRDENEKLRKIVQDQQRTIEELKGGECK